MKIWILALPFRVSALFSLTLAAPSNAVFSTNAVSRDVGASGIIHKTAIIGPEDNRETYEAYARAHNMSVRDVYKKFSGNVRLICDGEGGNANAVLQGDVFITAAHLFYNIDDDGTCHGRKELKECYVETLRLGGSAGKRYNIDIGSIMMGTTGDDCPTESSRGHDWAVFRLKCKPGYRCRVPGATPYSTNCDVARRRSAKSFIGSSILNVTAVTDNFEGVVSQYGRRVALVCESGHIRDAEFWGGGDRLIFDCSSGKGNSGGGIFVEAGNAMTLIGVLTNSATYDFDHRPYSKDGDGGNFTQGTFMSGAFCDAVWQENETSTQALTEFNRKDGVDIAGSTEEKIGNVYFQKCESACFEDSRCHAFSYDQENRLCFLKSTADALIKHPGFRSGIRSGLPVPAMSTDPLTIVRYPREAFPGSGYRTLSAGDADDCEAACKKEQACNAFTFEAPEPAVEQTASNTSYQGSTCHLFSEATSRSDNSFAESGIKMQMR